MGGWIDIHGDERKETDIRLIKAGPLVQSPTEFTDLRSDVGPESRQ
jgi:hypothetical protein